MQTDVRSRATSLFLSNKACEEHTFGDTLQGRVGGGQQKS